MDWILCLTRAFPRVFSLGTGDAGSLWKSWDPSVALFVCSRVSLRAWQEARDDVESRACFSDVSQRAERGIQKMGTQPLITTSYQPVRRNWFNKIVGNKNLFLPQAGQVLTERWSGSISLQSTLLSFLLDAGLSSHGSHHVPNPCLRSWVVRVQNGTKQTC